ncbi:MAG: SusC/RagA family TonB-linked outer membrane protein [Arachidicoccus sp.]|nr:SusC/RagA family TonB-linked outer membrane protein [Arachidicoccus sp.]
MKKSRLFSCKKVFLLFLASALCILSYAQDQSISGIVKSNSGTPLGGVTVIVQNSNVHSLTKDDGTYTIKAAVGAHLIFSYIGYQTQTLTASSASLDVILVQNDIASAGNDVVVTAFGVKRQERSLGYAVSTISAKDITETGATNFASAMYGKAAGVKIVSPPGGASTAVSVQIRGLSSISNNTQPLYVVDGVPIRLYNDLSGNSGNSSNNNGYWSNTQIQGNGVLDINPNDIASISILKGAAAAALYGSEATNGVVMITTKKGNKGKGLGVDLNYVINQEKVAYGPDYQNEYGPGDGPIWGTLNEGTQNDLFVHESNGVVHPVYSTDAQFGPKFDGQQVEDWDGTMRSYNAQPNNWKEFYQTGYNSSLNVAIANAGDIGNYRLSYNRVDYKGIMPGSNLNKNVFNFNGTLNLSKAVSVDLSSTYNYTFTHNRPYQMHQLFASFGGFFSRFDDMNTYKTRYKTTDGYKYVTAGGNQYDVDQAFAYSMNATNLLDYFWTALRDINNETQNRFMNSVTLNIALSEHLKLRGRVGNDYTSWNIINDNHNTQPSFVGPSGQYSTQNNLYNRVYGDGLITYTNKFSSDWNITIMGGVTARKDVSNNQYSTTQNGLVQENFFSLSNSSGTLQTSATRQQQNESAYFGTVDINFKNLLYLEGTGRHEGISTLPPGSNQFFYPSVSAGFILSDAVKLPTLFNYAKLRASYAEVGNYPGIYQANVSFWQSNVPNGSGNYIYQSSASSNFGNLNLKSELKKEMEFGLETRLLHNILGLDISYYNNKVERQILYLSTPYSTGTSSEIANAGNLSNYGVEAALNASPITSNDFKWTTGFNFSINKNKITALPNGVSTLTLSNQDGGYAIIQANVGDALGNIYVHPIATDGNGNKIITSSGIYQIDANSYKYVGNIMSKFVGGWTNTLTYKSFSLDLTFDYRLGGSLLSIPTYYQIGAGMYKNTLQYRDAAHGGISYNIVNGATVQAANGTFNDGIILKGVHSDGSTNSTIIDASHYYQYTYNWETTGDYENAVFKNSYIKFREAALNYNLPSSFAHKIHFQRLQLSLIGRNLFYIWKTLPHGLDPEIGVGSSWLSQGVDGGNPAPTRSMGLSLTAGF